jgi:type I restriction enzyme, S subunit
MREATDKKLWARVALGDVVANRRDQVDDRGSAGIDRVVGLDDLISGDLRVRRWKSVDDSPSFTTRFRPGQTLFGKRRAYLRKVAFADFEGVCTQNILVLESKDPNVLLPGLLPFLCTTDAFFTHAISTSEGSLFPNANWNAMAKYEFALPPLQEQKRIVSVLSGFEAQREALVAVLETEASLEKTVFAHALRGHLSGKAYRLKDSRFGMVPSSWDLVPVSRIATVAYGISEAVASNRDPSLGWPILTGANITLAGTLDTQKRVYIERPTKSEFILQRGDLLLNWRSGSEEHVGKTALFDLEGDWTYASFVLRIRPDDRTNRWFLWRLLNHMREFRLFGASTSQQVNFKMNAALFREVEVIVPPREIQDVIVSHLREHWTAASTIRARIDAAVSQKTGLLEGVARP